MAAKTGVFPVYGNTFKVSTTGVVTGTSSTSMKTIADLTTFKVSVEGKTEEWYPLDQEGWARNANTGKKLTISFTGKRNYGDAGNDYIAGMIGKTGNDCMTSFEWTMASGAKLAGNCVINLTTPAGGDSTAVDTLEFELIVDGKPTFTAAA